MKKQAFNPYLPLHEYVPDGEPYVFGDRVYIYGSHDTAGGEQYCLGDYVSWSAPLDDLGNWSYHGISYKKTDDPQNNGEQCMWAPDVAKGTDGRYYMYYCFAFGPSIAVCVADQPQGPFQYYGRVKYPEHLHGGKELTEYAPFDPGVLVDDDGRVYLYYGFGAEEQMHLPTREELLAAGMQEGPELDAIMAQCENVHFSPGAMCVELEQDMLTVRQEPHMIVPDSIRGRGTDYEGHGFYEASSMRKIGERYYFIYSSQQSHELCYAVSRYPDQEFAYGGTLVSNGDIGLNGNTEPVNTLGNNHGSIVCLNGDWYVFYHRQTEGTEFSRQGCAEKLVLNDDGTIEQAEITSCGLNGGPLAAEGSYPAVICCHLTSAGTIKNTDYQRLDKSRLAVITESLDGPEEMHEHFITNITDKTVVGYKYFDVKDVKAIGISIRGNAAGEIICSTDRRAVNEVGRAEVSVDSWDWVLQRIPVQMEEGVNAVYFTFKGEGAYEFNSFEFEK